MATVGTNAEKKANVIIWKYGDGIIPEVKYLIQRDKFKLLDDAFSVKSVKGWKTYPVTYHIRFHSVEKDELGAVKNLLFVVFESDAAKQDDYEQKMEYLYKNFGLIVDPDSDTQHYSLKLNGERYTFGRETKFEFFNVKRTAAEITSMDFNILLGDEKIWYDKDGTDTPELRYLAKEKHLVIDPDNFTEMYRYDKKNGEMVTYPQGSRIVFHNIKLNQNGEIINLSFQFQQLVWR